MSKVKRMKSIHATVFLIRLNSSVIHQPLCTVIETCSSACILQRVGRQVVNAPEAGDEARVARRNAPEGEIGQLEVDRLLRGPAYPRDFQVRDERILVRNLCPLAANGDSREGEGTRAAVVGLG